MGCLSCIAYFSHDSYMSMQELIVHASYSIIIVVSVYGVNVAGVYCMPIIILPQTWVAYIIIIHVIMQLTLINSFR